MAAAGGRGRWASLPARASRTLFATALFCASPLCALRICAPHRRALPSLRTLLFALFNAARLLFLRITPRHQTDNGCALLRIAGGLWRISLRAIRRASRGRYARFGTTPLPTGVPAEDRRCAHLSRAYRRFVAYACGVSPRACALCTRLHHRATFA